MSENPTSSSRLASRIPLCFGIVQGFPFVLIRRDSPPAYLMQDKARLKIEPPRACSLHRQKIRVDRHSRDRIHSHRIQIINLLLASDSTRYDQLTRSEFA